MEPQRIQLIREMAEAIAGGEAAFFVGAGLSAMAGAPSWDELIAQLRVRLQPRTDERNPLLVAQFFANQFSANELYLHVRAKFTARQLRPTKAHEALCSLPVTAFVTTNYDDLLETQLQDMGVQTHVIDSERQLAFWSEEREVQVLKLHGDLRSATSIVLTEWDYVRFLCDKSLMKRKLAELFTYRTVIFIGYSLRDPNVSYIFNAIAHELGGLKRPAYVVTFEADEHQQREWRRRGVRPLRLGDPHETPTSGEKTELLTDLLLDLLKEVHATNRSIMIVDDNEQLVRLWKQALAAEIDGATVHGARDGLAAMYAIGNLRPRLLIVDLNMPRLDGLEFITLVRQFPELDQTKIIVVTGGTHLPSPKQLEELHIDRVFEKPFTTVEMSTAVCALLGVRPRELHQSGRILKSSSEGDSLPAPSGTLIPPAEGRVSTPGSGSSTPGRTPRPTRPPRAR